MKRPDIKTKVDRARDVSLTLLTCVALYAMIAGFNYDINYRETNCYKSQKVVEITKVRYRSVWFTLEDGTEIEGGQPKVAIVPGKDYCTDLRRERNDVELSWWMTPIKIFE